MRFSYAISVHLDLKDYYFVLNAEIKLSLREDIYYFCTFYAYRLGVSVIPIARFEMDSVPLPSLHANIFFGQFTYQNDGGHYIVQFSSNTTGIFRLPGPSPSH